MEEKIIEAKFGKNILFRIVLSISIAVIALGFVIAWCEYLEWVDRKWFSFFDFLIENFCDVIILYRFHIDPILITLGVIGVIVAAIYAWKMGKCSLTVTNKRVTGKASFGKQVDLPINQISAISLGSSKSIGISTSSGKISFWCLSNRTEVYNAISGLLVNTQAPQHNNTTTDAPAPNDADELRKYKQLLDEGIITQEEFDAKKKQLLGL